MFLALDLSPFDCRVENETIAVTFVPKSLTLF